MKIFESNAEREQGILVAAGVAMHAILANPNSTGLSAEAMTKKAFEIAYEFLRQAESL